MVEIKDKPDIKRRSYTSYVGKYYKTKIKTGRHLDYTEYIYVLGLYREDMVYVEVFYGREKERKGYKNEKSFFIIRNEHMHIDFVESDDYIEISKHEYEQALLDTLKKVRKYE